MKRIISGRPALRRLLSGALALLLAVSLAGYFSPEASAASLSELKKQAQALEEKESELKQELKQLEKQAASKLEEKALLEQQISVLSAQILTTETLIAEYDGEIAVKQEELTAAQAEEDAYLEIFCARFRDMEEGGKLSYWSILFGSASFADLLDRIGFVAEVIRYDNQILSRFQDARRAVEAAKSAIETARAEQEEARASLETQKTGLEQEQAAVSAVIAEIETQAEEYEDQLDDIAAEAEKLDDKIAAAQKPSSGGVTGTGNMCWPCASRRVTSYFGNRSSPTAGASTYHKGIDIGADSGTAIYAADSGTVTESGYSSSRGNYLVISHGGGISTVYMHCKALYVGTGNSVSRGQTIAAVGSTGISTGPHLHFGVIVNGSYVNPLNYVH